jgi:TolA-binding protein
MRILVSLGLVLVLSSFIAAKALFLMHQDQTKLKKEVSALHSEHIAELDSGKSEVSKLMLSLEDEIKAMDKELESINNDLSGIQNKLVISQSNMDHAIEEATLEAAKADQATLDKYASGIVNVAITEMKNNVPYEKDIFTHAKELSRAAEVTANTEVISL